MFELLSLNLSTASGPPPFNKGGLMFKTEHCFNEQRLHLQQGEPNVQDGTIMSYNNYKPLHAVFFYKIVGVGKIDAF